MKSKGLRNVTDKKVVAELRGLHKQNDGVLSPSVVVEAARPVKSALHKCFEWDDSVAAQQWRLEQARNLLRVVVELLDVPDATPTRVFVSLSTDRTQEGGGYRSLVSVLSDTEMRKQLLADAVSDMRLFKLKYQKLSELADVVSAMTSAERRCLGK